MEMSLSHGPSNWEELLLADIYQRAEELSHVQKASFGGNSFEYAKISVNHSYDSDQKRYIRSENRSMSLGRNAEGLLFVFTDGVPKEEQDIVGFHEHLESTAAKGDHGLACKLELEEIVKNPELFQQHAKFLYDMTQTYLRRCAKKDPDSRGYFNRAINDFSRIIQEGKLPPLEVLKAFKKQLDVKYA